MYSMYDVENPRASGKSQKSQTSPWPELDISTSFVERGGFSTKISHPHLNESRNPGEILGCFRTSPLTDINHDLLPEAPPEIVTVYSVSSEKE